MAFLHTPFDPERFAILPEELQRPLLRTAIGNMSIHLLDPTAAMTYGTETGCVCDARTDDPIALQIAEVQLLRGQLSPTTRAAVPLVQAATCLLRGHYEDARAGFKQVLSHQRKTTGKRNALLPGTFGIFYVFALLESGQHNDIRTACRQCEQASKQPTAFSNLYRYLCFELNHYLSPSTHRNPSQVHLRSLKTNKISLIFRALTGPWFGHRPDANDRAFLANMAEGVRDNGYVRLAEELEASLEKPSTWFAEHHQVSFSNLLHSKETWDLQLETLEHLLETDVMAPRDAKERLIWEISGEAPDLHLQPILQRATNTAHGPKGENSR